MGYELIFLVSMVFRLRRSEELNPCSESRKKEELSRMDPKFPWTVYTIQTAQKTLEIDRKEVAWDEAEARQREDASCTADMREDAENSSKQVPQEGDLRPYEEEGSFRCAT